MSLFCKPQKILFSLVAISLLLSGCGGGGDSSSSNPASGTYNVSVVDDTIVGATVLAPECATFLANGNGSYTLKECIAVPSTIEAVGGFVDIDGDGIQDDDEAGQTAPLKLKVSQSGLSNSFTVTPLTTLASQEESDLNGLASKLGINRDDLFKDVESNRNLQRSINAILISAREAGITKYDAFVRELKNQIKSANGNGLTALTNAKEYMQGHVDNFKATYGVVFSGFISDVSGMDLSNGSEALKVAKGTLVSPYKIGIRGYIHDGIIAQANIKIYDGKTVLTTTTSDANGRYALEIDEALLSQAKVLKLEAILDKTKLISYITTDEIKAELIGKKLSSGTLEDLLISNVTTAKAVLVEKTAPEALTNSKKMTEAKIAVEKIYASELLTVAAAIKDVVDHSIAITQNDTLALAEEIVVVNNSTKEITTTVPSNITVTVSSVTGDPLLNSQLTSTKSPYKYDTLVAYEFDNSISDSSINKNNLTLTAGNLLFVEGKHGKGIDLNNTLLTTKVSGDFKEGMTLSCWVKTNKLDYMDIVNLNLEFLFRVYYPSHSGWKFALGLEGSQGDYYSVYPSNEPEIQINKWYHIVYTVDKNNKVRVWYNGREGLGAEGLALNLTKIDDLSQHTLTIGNFDGAVDDLRIYNRVLSSAAIQELAK